MRDRKRLVPLLLQSGREVFGTTRSPEKAQRLSAAGAQPLVLDVFDAEAVDYGEPGIYNIAEPDPRLDTSKARTKLCWHAAWRLGGAVG